MMYKTFNAIQGQCVIKINTQTYIPFDPSNTDYQEFLRWKSEGNEPLPADE